MWAITKKELRRVFRSPSMIIALIAPGLLIYAMYSIMGNFGDNRTGIERAREETFVIYAYNLSVGDDVHYHLVGIQKMFELNEFVLRELDAPPTQTPIEELLFIQDADLTGIEELLRGDADLVLLFSDVFDVNAFDNINVIAEAPVVATFFNPLNSTSNLAFTYLWTPAINSFQNYVVYDISMQTINPQLMFSGVGTRPTIDDRDFGGILADFIPMMLLIFLFSSCMTIVAESIAGEKERGTISTLLATPARRSEIAIGKIVPLCIIATISALSSFLGIMLSIPALLGGTVGLFDIFTFGEMTLLFFILISTVLLIVSTMAVMSAISKNIKEATMMISILMFVAMGASMLKMIIDIPTSWVFYLIPLFNTSASLAAVMSFEVSVINLAVTVISNIVYAVGLGWVLTKLFNNEKVMFAK